MAKKINFNKGVMKVCGDTGNPVKYIQDGNGYNGAGEFLGAVDQSLKLIKKRGRPVQEQVMQTDQQQDTQEQQLELPED